MAKEPEIVSVDEATKHMTQQFSVDELRALEVRSVPPGWGIVFPEPYGIEGRASGLDAISSGLFGGPKTVRRVLSTEAEAHRAIEGALEHKGGLRRPNHDFSVGDEVEFREKVCFTIDRSDVCVEPGSRGIVVWRDGSLAVDVPSLNLPDFLLNEDYCEEIAECTGNIVVFEPDDSFDDDWWDDWESVPPTLNFVPRVLQKIRSRAEPKKHPWARNPGGALGTLKNRLLPPD